MVSKIEQYAINQVKARRLAIGLSQAALAAEANLSYGFIGDVEAGKRKCKYNLNHLNMFAIVLKCSVHDFLPTKPIIDNQAKVQRK